MKGFTKRTIVGLTPVRAFLLVAVCLLAQDSCSNEGSLADRELLPAERIADWAVAGVWENGVKGIPVRNVVFCDVRTSIPGSGLVAAGDGVRDDTAALQAALDLCPAGQVVYLPQGVYRISGTLAVRDGIVVRGDGPERTRIVQYSAEHILLIEGLGASGDDTATRVVSGFQRGSDTVEVDDSGGFEVGDAVTLDEFNDPEVVTPKGEGGTCDWCGRQEGSRAMAETLLVKAKNGSSLTFNRALYFDYKSIFLPQLYKASEAPVRHAGIEDLAIEMAAGSGEGAGIVMSYCVHCWVRNVETVNIPYKHIEMEWGAYGNEVRDSYIHGTPRYDGDHGYGINIHCYASDNLVENNILYSLHTGVVIGGAGGAGNVVGYNYMERTEHHQPNWFQYHIGSHGAHTCMNLWEGNVAGKVQFDAYWGSGSHHMVFRNHLTRLNPGQPVTSDIAAAIIDAHNYDATFVGNILGTPGCQGPAEQVPLTTREENPVLWIIGYAEGSGTGQPDDPEVDRTLIRSGNWECATNRVEWRSRQEAIPDSLYLSGKPAWFGILDWPPFTPERSGFDPASIPKIPAQVRFESGLAPGSPVTAAEGASRR